jgi:hypothetical protein
MASSNLLPIEYVSPFQKLESATYLGSTGLANDLSKNFTASAYCSLLNSSEPFKYVAF